MGPQTCTDNDEMEKVGSDEENKDEVIAEQLMVVGAPKLERYVMTAPRLYTIRVCRYPG